MASRDRSSLYLGHPLSGVPLQSSMYRADIADQSPTTADVPDQTSPIGNACVCSTKSGDFISPQAGTEVLQVNPTCSRRILLCAGRDGRVVRYALGGRTRRWLWPSCTYDALPVDEQAALPRSEDIVAAMTGATALTIDLTATAVKHDEPPTQD